MAIVDGSGRIQQCIIGHFRYLFSFDLEYGDQKKKKLNEAVKGRPHCSSQLNLYALKSSHYSSSLMSRISSRFLFVVYLLIDSNTHSLTASANKLPALLVCNTKRSNFSALQGTPLGTVHSMFSARAAPLVAFLEIDLLQCDSGGAVYRWHFVFEGQSISISKISQYPERGYCRSSHGAILFLLTDSGFIKGLSGYSRPCEVFVLLFPAFLSFGASIPTPENEAIRCGWKTNEAININSLQIPQYSVFSRQLFNSSFEHHLPDIWLKRTLQNKQTPQFDHQQPCISSKPPSSPSSHWPSPFPRLPFPQTMLNVFSSGKIASPPSRRRTSSTTTKPTL